MSDQASEGRYTGRGATTPRWWPSRYGADDDLGAGNELTSERVLAALQLPRSGEVIELGQVLEAGVPLPPRGWNQLILSHETLEDKLLPPPAPDPPSLRNTSIRPTT